MGLELYRINLQLGTESISALAGFIMCALIYRAKNWIWFAYIDFLSANMLCSMVISW